MRSEETPSNNENRKQQGIKERQLDQQRPYYASRSSVAKPNSRLRNAITRIRTQLRVVQNLKTPAGPRDRLLAPCNEECGGEPSTAVPTVTDEGYQSMNKSQRCRDADHEEAASETDSIRTDLRSSGLSEDIKAKLVSVFAGDIIEKLGEGLIEGSNSPEAVNRISSLLPVLLKDFSLLVGSHAQSELGRRASVFVRHQRW